MKDGPLEVKETRFGFIWGNVHVERIGVEDGRAGIYIADGQGNGLEIHVPLKGGPLRVFKNWQEIDMTLADLKYARDSWTAVDRKLSDTEASLTQERQTNMKLREALEGIVSGLDFTPTMGGRLGDGTDPGKWYAYLNGLYTVIRARIGALSTPQPSADE